MKALITGVNGFVGRHLEEYLVSQQIEVWGTSRSVNHEKNHINRVQLDFNQEEAIVQLLNTIKPDLIFHLAAQSSVAKSWTQVSRTLDANVTKTALFYDAIKQSDISDTVKILSVGSSEEYGIVSKENIPISETAPLNPTNPYGISKVTQHMLAKLYSSLGLHIVHVRPFNHIGPGQKQGFVTSDFARQIALIESQKLPPVITVGNLEAQRDFTDVRDIVRAYAEVIQKGRAGEVYNICSGKSHPIRYILDYLLTLSTNKSIDVQQDINKMRPSEFPIYIGDSTKINNLIGWDTEYLIEESLVDILTYWRSIL
ncbi:hypothetical protein AK95_05585 [Paenibacillus sp. LC231]|uniref:GDP-mannose 4,6-dehydratase n=1 Tax=Paenibacillus sp. LC231 TaxID=1120679 RepID=UPI0008DDD520|nr:GDP-mannose 4,6-dehydratase [Paenibacillus sp. LC231]OIB03082.1 hypothetical protein AK95_05585 [Paenibacillus sp. LC231]